MIAVTARTIPKTYASLAGGFGAMCPLPARQIDVAMRDFGGANRERCVSYVTLRRLSKKCKVAKKPHGTGDYLDVGEEKARAIAGQGKLSRAGLVISSALPTLHSRVEPNAT
jgi:hypothetical protein